MNVRTRRAGWSGRTSPSGRERRDANKRALRALARASSYTRWWAGRTIDDTQNELGRSSSGMAQLADAAAPGRFRHTRCCSRSFVMDVDLHYPLPILRSLPQSAISAPVAPKWLIAVICREQPAACSSELAGYLYQKKAAVILDRYRLGVQATFRVRAMCRHDQTQSEETVADPSIPSSFTAHQCFSAANE